MSITADPIYQRSLAFERSLLAKLIDRAFSERPADCHKLTLTLEHATDTLNDPDASLQHIMQDVDLVAIAFNLDKFGA